jgi:hypothetical protein
MCRDAGHIDAKRDVQNFFVEPTMPAPMIHVDHYGQLGGGNM